ASYTLAATCFRSESKEEKLGPMSITGISVNAPRLALMSSLVADIIDIAAGRSYGDIAAGRSYGTLQSAGPREIKPTRSVGNSDRNRKRLRINRYGNLHMVQ